jgi:hypothetical protein
MAQIHDKLLAGKIVAFDAKLPPESRTINPDWIAEAASRHVRIGIVNAILVNALGGSPDLSYTTFDEQVTFIGCTFEGTLGLEYSVFRQGLRLDGSTFRKGIHLQNATFNGEVVLDRSVFDGGPCLKMPSFVVRPVRKGRGLARAA